MNPTGITHEELNQVRWKEQHELQQFQDLRRFANPSLTKDDNITSGNDFPKFLRTMYYGWDPYADQATTTMEASFACWCLLKKLFLSRYPDLYLFFKWRKQLSHFTRRFEAAFDRVSGKRKCVVTKDGRYGWVPIRTREQDQIFIFQGSRIPFIAQLVEDDGWEYTGPCYIDGLMFGEAWTLPENEWWFMRFV